MLPGLRVQNPMRGQNRRSCHFGTAAAVKKLSHSFVFASLASSFAMRELRTLARPLRRCVLVAVTLWLLALGTPLHGLAQSTFASEPRSDEWALQSMQLAFAVAFASSG